MKAETGRGRDEKRINKSEEGCNKRIMKIDREGDRQI